ncbi:MAG: hypothetical protein JW803_07185 [Endomicrobiales bacterium]|nr:hypothetical protein [Endomicrobiales bacterium]
MRAKIILLALLLLPLFFFRVPAHSRSIFQKQFDNNHELEFEIDMYYSALDYFIPLTERSIPFVDEDNELKIYRHLFLSPVPRFVVLEVSANPLPLLGVYVRKEHYDLYRRADISENANVIKAVCAGFEEPWAASVFFGNVISFRPKGEKISEGKGFAGFLASAGNYHIKDNQTINDDWHELELKVKGDRIVPENKINWSFRVGMKNHDNPNIKDVFYFALRRDRIDFDDYSMSIFKNSGVEYVFDVANDSKKIIRHFFRISKKVPLKGTRVALSVNTGFIWEGEEKYTGPLKRTGEVSAFQFVLQPNLEF